MLAIAETRGRNDCTMSVAAQSRSIWNRIVAPGIADMPPEAARFILSLGFAPADLKRYKRLASKDQSELGISEREELESLVQANTALMLLQAKARLSLQSPRKTA
jgi:hypothetical protein